MRIKLATWNINSVRLREGLVLRLLHELDPDILCLQETKSPVDLIPRAGFADAGYPHLIARGQKGYNGVAVLSKAPIEDAGSIDFCAKGDARHVSVRHESGLVVHNLYVPAGGDVPDRDANDKFAHKLDFVSQMQETFDASHDKSVLVGDFNIAPLEHDVWSHKQLLKVVSHTPVEVDALNSVQQAGGWIDTSRRFVDSDAKLYSWWSYRARDWAASNKGRRLDHIWASADLDGAIANGTILREVRGWEKGSDHAPVVTTFDL
ncbi:MAG: exodeoxyribonuclease III [Neomegalonema sp.]|nr:exodeoxyribonuclease III [Neomegalonema sp.]